jgi:transposase
MEYLRVNKQYYCGVDLHADVMYVCVMTKDGRIVLHHQLPTDFSRFHKAIKPFLKSIAVCAESTFNWYWLSDGCAQHGIPFFLGHALYMKLIHGGKAKNDKLDARVMADLLRTGFFPPAYAYPVRMRPTRDLLRRRHRFSNLRAGFLRHIKILLYQQGYMDLPDLTNEKVEGLYKIFLSYKVPEDIEVSIRHDLAMIERVTELMAKLEARILKSAEHHDNRALALLRTVKGLGPILSLTMLYEIHTIARFKTHQRFCSYCRVVKVEHSSHGKKLVSRNQKIGNPYLRWAFGHVATQAQRFYPQIKGYAEKLTRKFGKKKAYSLLAHKFAVVVYYMLKNKTAFNVERFTAA